MSHANLRTYAMTSIKSVVPFVAALLLAACTSIEDVIPQDGPTMLEIYENHLSASRAGLREMYEQQDRASPADAPTALSPRGLTPVADTEAFARMIATTRTPSNEIDVLFPQLPNPTLVMYIFPHFAGQEQLPVPGYATSFSLFERTVFALPSETSKLYAPAASEIVPFASEPATPRPTAFRRASAGGR